MALPTTILQRGARAAQPAATAVAAGTLYCVTDENFVLEQSTGAAWQDYSPTGGSGTVTNTGTLTSGKAIIGNGSADVTVSALTAQFVGSSSGTAAAASMSTARLLGRTTASSGAVEEITVGSGLSLSAGSLTATGGGGLVLLQTYTPSGAASVDITSLLSSTYNEYIIKLEDLVTNQTNTDLLLTASTDNGSSWLGGTTYQAVYVWTAADSGLQSVQNSSGRANIQLAQYPGLSIWASGTGRGLIGEFSIRNVNGSLYKYVNGKVSVLYTNGIQLTSRLEALVQTTSVINALQLAPLAGTVTGTVYVFGVEK